MAASKQIAWLATGVLSRRSAQGFVCHRCQTRGLSLATGFRYRPRTGDTVPTPGLQREAGARRRITASAWRRDLDTTKPSQAEATSNANSHPDASPPPRTELPSQSHSRRSDISKRMQAFMDEMMARAALAGQRVNTYTGTDYSGIEKLRQEIIAQERLLKDRLSAVEEAKLAYNSAHTQQGSSQKEVVSLLERKSSWTPSDLDRYTALIRSEHLHEQSVSSARQTLAGAERELETARTDLERKERQQYHEEQIWSDTIRRNSTWVTFGLIGLNILLLVANIGIFEPWRRRRLVREVREALDQKTFMVDKVTPLVEEQIATAPVPTELVKAVEVAVEPDLPPAPEAEVVLSAAETSAAEEMMRAPAVEVPVVTPESSTPSRTSPWTSEELMVMFGKTWERSKLVAGEWWQGPFSSEPIQLRKVELTSVALEGAAIGLLVLGCILKLARASQ